MAKRHESPAQLTAKQQRFIDEYLVDLNATQAALRAGYSPKTAHRSGAENLQKPAIMAAVGVRQSVLQAKAEVRQETVIEELRRVAFSDLREVIQWGPDGTVLRESSSLAPPVAATVQGVKCVTRTKTWLDDSGASVTEREVLTELKLYDKLKALEGLGKHLGLFVDRQRLEMDPEFLQHFVARLLTYVPDQHDRQALVAFLEESIRERPVS